MAENEKAEELIRFVRSLGFDGEQLEKDIREEHEKFSPSFTVTHQITFGDELMRYALRFVHDRQFMAYKLTGYRAIHRDPIMIEHQIINGIDTEKLEKDMATIDWESYFSRLNNEGENVISDDSSMAEKEIERSLSKLTEEHNFDGKEIQSRLIFKYWPKEYWNEAAKELQSAYENTQTFNATGYGLCNATLAYNIVSGRLNQIAGELTQLGLKEYPGIDVQDLLSVYLSQKNQTPFDINCSGYESEGITDFRIQVDVINDAYSLGTIDVTFTRYPEINHGNFSGVDTALLEEQFRNINWKNADLHFIDKNDDVHLLPHIQELLDKIRQLDNNSDGQIIGDYLQVKYWSANPVMENHIDDGTWCKGLVIR